MGGFGHVIKNQGILLVLLVNWGKAGFGINIKVENVQ